MKNCTISTTFAGINLSNPIIVSSCTLTGVAVNNEALSAIGVGAIVLKSLFEEDIIRESAALSIDTTAHAEIDYLQAYVTSKALTDYIKLIKESKALCGTTPIIASICCANSGEWATYARAIEAAGADALELNVMSVECDPTSNDGDLEQRHIAIAQSVRAQVKLPLIMKMGAIVSNHVNLVSRLKACNINGFVLFNRAYPLDIDIDSMSYTHGAILSEQCEFSTPLRYTAMTSAALPATSLALSGGVQTPEAIIKSILAGASAVEICSVFYHKDKNGSDWVLNTIRTLKAWMEKQDFDSIEAFCGAMNSKSDEHHDAVMRTQFLKHFGTFTL